jgi:hypothetical protein
MGCGSSSTAVDAAAGAEETQQQDGGSNEDRKPEQSEAASLPTAKQQPGSPQAVIAAATKLRIEVEAQSAAELRRLEQSSEQSSERSQQQEAAAEEKLRQTELALSQLLKLIESQKDSLAEEGSVDLYVPSLGGPPTVADQGAAAAAPAHGTLAPAALPVALS